MFYVSSFLTASYKHESSYLLSGEEQLREVTGTQAYERDVSGRLRPRYCVPLHGSGGQAVPGVCTRCRWLCTYSVALLKQKQAQLEFDMGTSTALSSS